MKTAYCFGHISTGKLYKIKGSFPQANGYAEYTEILDNYAGEALSSSLVLQRLGIPTILEGNWIGDNEDGRKTLEFIHKNDITLGNVHIQPGYAGVNEIVISDATTRTVFGRYCDLLFTTRQWEMPTPNFIKKAGVITTDPSFGEATLQVAEYAKKYSIPFVSIDAPYDSIIIANSNYTIISEDFILQKYPDIPFEELFTRYLSHCNGLVIFTFGSAPVWYGRTEKYEMPVFSVPVVDTAGAGDSFRAGIMYGILKEMDDIAMIQFASAVAASIIQTSPGVVNFKGITDVNKILNTI